MRILIGVLAWLGIVLALGLTTNKRIAARFAAISMIVWTLVSLIILSQVWGQEVCFLIPRFGGN